jgi:hypothetical protein
MQKIFKNRTIKKNSEKKNITYETDEIIGKALMINHGAIIGSDKSKHFKIRQSNRYNKYF